MQATRSYNLSLVPIVTLTVGFLSFLVMSIYFKVFWVTSKYDVPLIYNFSVMFGDFIILPVLNYKIFNLFLNQIGLETIKKYRRRLISWVFIAFVISFISNLITHLFWVNDQITDFIAFKQGEFSIIGYWHLVYSILQMLLLFTFPFFWFVAIKEKNNLAIRYSHHIWKYVLLFSTLAIFDMLSKYLFVYHNGTLLHAMQADKFAFFTVILSFILLYIMNIIEKRNNAFQFSTS